MSDKKGRSNETTPAANRRAFSRLYNAPSGKCYKKLPWGVEVLSNKNLVLDHRIKVKYGLVLSAHAQIGLLLLLLQPTFSLVFSP